MAKINGKTVKLAVFDEQGQKDLENGKAVFNNGYRTKSGQFMSKQPEFIDIDTVKVNRKTAKAQSNSVLSDISQMLYYDVIRPELRHLIRHQALPRLCSFIDDLLNPKATSSAVDTKTMTNKGFDDSKIVPFQSKTA